LVGYITVVFAGVALANGGLHETGEGRKDVDRWVDTTVVEGTVDEDLTFRNVASKIRNRVRNVYCD